METVYRDTTHRAKLYSINAFSKKELQKRLRETDFSDEAVWKRNPGIFSPEFRSRDPWPLWKRTDWIRDFDRNDVRNKYIQELKIKKKKVKEKLKPILKLKINK